MSEKRKALLSNALRANLLKRKKQTQNQQTSKNATVVSLFPVTIEKIEQSLASESNLKKKLKIA
jgi:hypothetical protein